MRSNSSFGLTALGWALLLGVGASFGFALQAPQQLLYKTTAAPRAVTPRGDLAAGERTNVEIFEANAPSVVHITTVKEQRVQSSAFSYDVLDVPQGQGSGFVWDSDGYLVTNYHVVREASGWSVMLADGSTVEASFVGADPTNDVAVLKIDPGARDLRPVVVGESDGLKVGQRVFAIGSPFGLDQTLTTGILSGLDRTMTSLVGNRIRGVLQTDAAINPGNSGGPLLDSAGRLIGINTAIFSTSGSSAGIGFAVPVDTVNRVVPQIIATGQPERPMLGIRMVPDGLARRAGLRGAVVSEVVPGSGADEAGLRDLRETRLGVEYDLIVGIDGSPVTSERDVFRILAEREIGDVVQVEVVRDERRLTVPVTLRVVR
ncbi:MAG: trypsin-like peptidase domain-containing protein [Planctomycetota bacterium]